MKRVLIIAPNFLPESVGGASRIYEMAKEMKNEFDVSVICPPPTYPFTKYDKSNCIFKKEILDGIKSRASSETISTSSAEARIAENVGIDQHSVTFTSLKNTPRGRYIKNLKDKCL